MIPEKGGDNEMSKSIAVFGIGRFGRSLALELAREGADVLAVDRDESIIESIADDVTCAITAELSNEEAMKSMGLEEMDAVVVAMGSDLEASIVSVMVSRECGVPYIMAKASNERMGAILTKVGADQVIYPEEETGIRTAKALFHDSIHDLFEIDEDLCILRIPPRKEWIGKPLQELNLRNRYGINIIAIKEPGLTHTHSHIGPDTVIREEMELFVIVNKEDVYKIR